MSAELPDRIRVKISSEAAGEILMTPVVSQDLLFRDLLDVLLGVCGKDPARIAELLSRGSVVQSASKFRWQGFEPDPARLTTALAAFPDPDPAQAFDPARCTLVRLSGPRLKMDLPRAVASAKRFFKRRSFWTVLMEAGRPEYVDYSYAEHADRYRLPADNAALAEAAGLLTYSGLAEQVRRGGIEQIEFFVARK